MGYYLQDNPNTTTPQFGWPRNRVSGVVGVHTTESGVVPSGPDNGAENTANFIRRRSDYGSYHTMADADSIIHLVHPRYAAWADTTNNAHAMSVSGAMNAARWRDLTAERANAIVRNMAHAAATLVQTAVRDGLLASPTPARRISAEEAKAGTRAGFYGHGETNPGTRYDPGANFNWDLFLRTYDADIKGTPQEEEDMPITEKDAELIADRVLNRKVAREGGPKGDTNLRATVAWLDGTLGRVINGQVASEAQIANLIGAVAAVSKGEKFDEAKLLAGVKAAAEAGVKAAIDSIETTVTLEG